MQFKSWLPRLVLLTGCILVSLRLFFPPKYLIFNGVRVNVPQNAGVMYPHTDFQTAILHSLGIAVLTGIIYFILIKWTPGKIVKAVSDNE